MGSKIHFSHGSNFFSSNWSLQDIKDTLKRINPKVIRQTSSHWLKEAVQRDWIETSPSLNESKDRQL